MSERGTDSKVRKRLFIVVTILLGVSLVIWVLLIAGVFSTVSFGTREKSAPEGYVTVFRKTAEYKLLKSGERVLVYSAEYDDNARVLKENEYDEKGILNSSGTYEYDQSGREILHVVRYPSKAKDKNVRDATITTTRKYDENGKLTEEVTNYDYSKDAERNHIITKTWTYDDAGNCIRDEIRSASLNYDDFEYTEYYPDGTIKEKRDDDCLETYNEHGDLLQTIDLKSNEIRFEYEYSYTEEGRITRKIGKTDRDDTITEYRYRYDGEGRLITDRYVDGEQRSEEIEYQDDMFRYREKYQYATGGERWLSESRKTSLDDTYQLVQDYSEDGTLKHDSLKEWDEKGRILLRLGHSEGRISTWIVNEYEDLPGSILVNRETEKFSDGSIKNWKENTTLPDETEVGNISWNYAHADEKPFPEGKYGYYYELDEYYNPVKKVSCSDGLEIVTHELEYAQFVIPKSSAGE